jgi:MFS family permease
MSSNTHSSRASTSVPMRRIALASLWGTTIEFYDFFIYGTAAALVFGKVFFPGLGASAATAASFATLGVAFLFRPLGAILFGHLGDRLGRKRTLVSTLLLMGSATVAVGLLPTATSIGAAAPIALVVLRAVQGLAVGGEWAGAALLTAEYAPKGKRGLYGMFPQLGPSSAFGLSSATFLVTALTMSPEAFQSWGWRIPFLVSIVLVAVGLYVRLQIAETPVFRQAVARLEQAKVPVAEALRHQWREILLVGGTLTMLFGFFYIGSVYLTSYAGPTPPPATHVGVLGLTRPTILACGIAASVVGAAVVALSALVSDRVGRRRVILVGNLVAIVWGLVLFPLMQPGSALLFGVGLTGTSVCSAIAYGPAAAYLPEIFSTRYRCTAAGMGYNLAGILGGALPLIVAPWLTAAFGGIGVGVYMAALGLLSMVCVLALKETRDVALDRAVVPAPAAVECPSTAAAEPHGAVSSAPAYSNLG